MLFIRCLVVGAALSATAAVAQYRDNQPPMAGEAPYRAGQPETLEAPIRIDPNDAVFARFGSRYRQARSPRIVIFWNREFTDDLDSEYEDYTRVDTRTDMDAAARRRTSIDYDGAVTRSSGEASVTSSAEIRSGRTRVNDGKQASLHTRAEDRDIEQAFTSTLNAAGARLADRTSLMRRKGLAARGNTGNVQAVETEAVLDGSDLVLEITQVPDSRRAAGVSFQVLARDVAGGRVLGQITTSGQPPRRVMPYVAGASGFVRAVQPEPNASDIGRQIAIETMTMLSSRF